MNHPLLIAIASIVLLIGYSNIAEDKTPNSLIKQQTASIKKKAIGLIQGTPQTGDEKYAAKIVTAKGDTIIYRPYFVPKKIIR